jgi:hypothetical protein
VKKKKKKTEVKRVGGVAQVVKASTQEYKFLISNSKRGSYVVESIFFFTSGTHYKA